MTTEVRAVSLSKEPYPMISTPLEKRIVQISDEGLHII
jgi:hypothetical protein